MHKKSKRMQDGGMATTTAAPVKGIKPPGQKMMARYDEMRKRFPGYSPGTAAPTDRRSMRDFFKGAKDYNRFTNRYNRLSTRFPDYKPTLSSPVDTREEFKTYRSGLRDYLKANPSVRATKPARPEKDYGMRKKAMSRNPEGAGFARGGLVKANGVAQRGKTKGKMC